MKNVEFKYHEEIKGNQGILKVNFSSKEKSICLLEYQIEVPEYQNPKRLEKFINAFCLKKLQQFKHENVTYVKLDDFKYEYDTEQKTLRVWGYNGIDTFNMGLNQFFEEFDIFLFYYLMSLTDLGTHLKVLREVVREQHQWHWLDEAPKYEDLILD